MDFMTWRKVLIWAVPGALFAMCWAWAASSFGLTGFYVGWIPALIIGRLAAMAASVCWSIVALTVLLAWHFYASDKRGTRRRRLSA